MKTSGHDVTGLLQAWTNGDQTVLPQLSDLIYVELKRRSRVARDRIGKPRGTYAVINEALLQLVNLKRIQSRSRARFHALAASMMRRVLVDDARSRYHQPRGAGVRPIDLTNVVALSKDRTADFLALDEAIGRLGQTDPRRCEIAELYIFGGFYTKEIAADLETPDVEISRDWNATKDWLEQEIARSTSRSFIKPLSPCG
jgi:RNA polymerase sigma factor (TIGR02999 family)